MGARSGPGAVAIIPARYASTRFPAKLLQRGPDGKTLLQYTCEGAAGARLIREVIVATDDERIRDAVAAWGGRAVMTAKNHSSGTDRIAEVARALDDEIIVNVQGDEPQVRGEMVDQAVQLLRDDPSVSMSTLAHEIGSAEEWRRADVVKVVLDNAGCALYFSRAPIPVVRGAADPFREAPARPLRHIGLYAYRRDLLLRYASLPPTPLEEAEKLEQLRALANGYRIRVGVTPFRCIGVDTPEDFAAFLAARRQVSPT